ncbi:MAG: electron transport complex subunit RsxG [Betaproteobacteria bacterium]|nr:electron transport complex subunit RsxG [Betaproteobacteria bacterium]
MKTLLRESLTTSLNLLAFSVIGAALLVLAYNATHAAIEASETASKQALLAQTLPQGGFDNDLVRAARPVPADPLLGLKRPGLAYPARLGGAPAGVVLEVVAPDGYSGEIRLLVGVLADGRIGGVRVTAHRETPGLGDYIDIAKGNWITQFVGKSAQEPGAEGWKVKKDGGRFDYAAGATITPRAVVKAVYGALRYFEAHRAELLQPTEASQP